MYLIDPATKAGRWKREPLNIQHLWESDAMTSLYYGFRIWHVLYAFYGLLGEKVHIADMQYIGLARKCIPCNKRSPPRLLRTANELLMTLTRLQLALLENDLAFRFCGSESHVSNLIRAWICLRHQHIVVHPNWWPFHAGFESCHLQMSWGSF